jgi:hypothetical protein
MKKNKMTDVFFSHRCIVANPQLPWRHRRGHRRGMCLPMETPRLFHPWFVSSVVNSVFIALWVHANGLH